MASLLPSSSRAHFRALIFKVWVLCRSTKDNIKVLIDASRQILLLPLFLSDPFSYFLVL